MKDNSIDEPTQIVENLKEKTNLREEISYNEEMDLIDVRDRNNKVVTYLLKSQARDLLEDCDSDQLQDYFERNGCHSEENRKPSKALMTR